MLQRYITAQAAFEHLFFHIKYSGELFANKTTKAIFNVSFEILYPLERNIETSWRRWKESYAELEYQWYLSGDRNPEVVEHEAKIWTSIKDDSGYVNSNYGWWWLRNDQLKRMIEILKTDPESRRAILVHYNPDNIQDYTKDTPCNVVLNFYIHKKELHMTIFARSIDLVFGFCNDQYCFSRLQEDVAMQLGITAGSSHYFITNLHIYEKHWELNQRSK